MNNSIYNGFPDAARELMENKTAVSSAEIDDCLNKCQLTEEQLKEFADAVVDKTVCSGIELSVRRMVCRARILNCVTLQKMSLISPYSVKRLEDIENGRIDYILPAECRFFNDLFGLSCQVSSPSILNEPSAGGCIVKLNDMESYTKYQQLDKYAEKHCIRKFEADDYPGMNDIVIEAAAEMIGYTFKGKLLLMVDELENEDQKRLSLCKMNDGSYLLLEPCESGYRSITGVCYEDTSVAWRLPLRQAILKTY